MSPSLKDTQCYNFLCMLSSDPQSLWSLQTVSGGVNSSSSSSGGGSMVRTRFILFDQITSAIAFASITSFICFAAVIVLAAKLALC